MNQILDEEEILRLLELRSLVEAFTVNGGRSANYALDKASLWVTEYLLQKDTYLKRTLSRIQNRLEVQGHNELANKVVSAEPQLQQSSSKTAGRPRKKESNATQ